MTSIARTGLVNTGNKCFMNATLQCLASSPFIHQYLIKYMPDDIRMITCINKYGLSKMKLSELETHIETILKDKENIIPEEDIKTIVERAIDFDAPLVALEKDTYVLELFHGPSMALR